jgi:hypothetical protein
MFWLPSLSPKWVVTKVATGRGIFTGYAELASVVAPFVRSLPWDGGEGALEEGVVDDVALVVFAFDDPVAWIGFTLAAIGEDGGGLGALCGVYEKGSASTKGIQFSSPDGVVLPTRYMFSPRS